jgi:hypothetical protein
MRSMVIGTNIQGPRAAYRSRGKPVDTGNQTGSNRPIRVYDRRRKSGERGAGFPVLESADI